MLISEYLWIFIQQQTKNHLKITNFTKWLHLVSGKMELELYLQMFKISASCWCWKLSWHYLKYHFIPKFTLLLSFVLTLVLQPDRFFEARLIKGLKVSLLLFRNFIQTKRYLSYSFHTSYAVNWLFFTQCSRNISYYYQCWKQLYLISYLAKTCL